MNYTELKQALKDWLENQETTFSGNLDLFIKLGERRLYMSLDIPAVRKNATSSTVSGQRLVGLPSDLINIMDVEIISSGQRKHLLRAEEGFIQAAYQDDSVTAEPKYYSVYDESNMLLGPVPDAIYTLEMTYTGVPTSIVTASNTWLGDNCERALLYACMVEGYVFMKGSQDVMEMYERAYREEVLKIDAMAAKKAHVGDLFRQLDGGNG